METRYALDETDYLNFQLFTASKSKQVRESKRDTLIWMIVLFLLLSFMSYQSGSWFHLAIFVVVAVCVVALFPFYLKWRYKNHYLKHIRDTRKNTFGKECSIKIGDEYIETFDETGEGKIKISQVEKISETGNYYFIPFLSGHALIIPKQKINNPEEVATALKKLAGQQKIPFLTELDWKWK